MKKNKCKMMRQLREETAKAKKIEAKKQQEITRLQRDKQKQVLNNSGVTYSNIACRFPGGAGGVRLGKGRSHVELIWHSLFSPSNLIKY